MDKKAFKQKIESNRKKAFGGSEKREKKSYSPKTNKPKPTTYEAKFMSVRNALAHVCSTSSELKDFVDYIYDLNNPVTENWFDDMLHKVGEYMLKRSPQLQQKRNIHAKYSISVNGFSIKLESNIGFDLSVKYDVVDGNAVLGEVYCAITVYGKVNPSTTVMLEESDTWKKKEFKKPIHKKPYNKDRNNDNYKKSYSKDGYNKKPSNYDKKASYYSREY